jgi:hypothetical protein
MAAPGVVAGKRLMLAIPLKLAPYEFVIDVNESEDLAKRWLAFQVRLECPYPACYIYAPLAQGTSSRSNMAGSLRGPPDSL